MEKRNVTLPDGTSGWIMLPETEEEERHYDAKFRAALREHEAESVNSKVIKEALEKERQERPLK